MWPWVLPYTKGLQSSWEAITLLLNFFQLDIGLILIIIIFLSFFLCFVATRKKVTNTEREPAKRWPSWTKHETQQHQLLENENNRIFFFILLVYCLVFCNVLHPCLDDGHGEFDDDVKVVEMLSHMQWSKWVLQMNFSSVVKMGTNNNNGD